MSSPRSIPTADRISDLPDSILCHILSFIPTKDAATTSILSKRWKLLWLSVLTLDFDDETFKDFNSFRKFVFSTIFSLRDDTLSVRSFRIKCGSSSFSHFKQRYFNRVFNFVMEKKVENLNFHMPADKNFHMPTDKKVQIKSPPCILSFKTLEVLKFENIQILDYDQVDFPRVKTLYLSNVSFKYREYLVKFLLGFPILEDLQTKLSEYRPWKKIENLNAIPNLVKVRVCDYHTPMTLVCNAKNLYVEWTLWITSSKGLPMFHNLTHLELGYYSTKICYIKCSWLLEILPHFPKLQHFIIQADRVDGINIARQYWMDPPTNYVPECLSSHLKTCCIKGYTGKECEFEFAKYIMQYSRVLETMSILVKKKMKLCQLRVPALKSTKC